MRSQIDQGLTTNEQDKTLALKNLQDLLVKARAFKVVQEAKHKKSPLNNTFHIESERRLAEAIAQQKPITQEQFIKQSQILKKSLSSEIDNNKNV